MLDLFEEIVRWVGSGGWIWVGPLILAFVFWALKGR